MSKLTPESCYSSPGSLDGVAQEENPHGVQEAEVVVGIYSCNEADTIPFVAEQAAIGLKTYFPQYRSVLINCDNSFRDGTRDAFFSAPGEAPRIYLSSASGAKGKGNSIRDLLRKVIDLKARVAVVVDANLRSITPRWIKHLGEPVLGSVGFVAPIYVRPKFDGTTTNHISCPFIRAMYGRRIWQPNGSECSFSGDMARHFMESSLWDPHVLSSGIHVWMTTLALNSPFPVAQAFLGGPKIHKARVHPGAGFDTLFVDVVSTILRLLEPFEATWTQVLWSKPTPIFGFGLKEVEIPPPPELEEEWFFKEFVNGCRRNEALYRQVLSEEVCLETERQSRLTLEQFELSAPLWAKIVYDFAIGFQTHRWMGDDLVRSMIPLYLGRTGTLVKATRGGQVREVEDWLEEQCVVFEESKPYLLGRWEEVKKLH